MGELTGGCGCGAVRFAVSEPLTGALYCHCTGCQRRTGSGAGASARVVPGSFTVTQGEDAVTTWRPGGGFDKCFCSVCGSAVFARSPDDPDQVVVRMGVFDEDPGVRPRAHQFVAYAAAWEPIPDDGLPRYDERMPA